MTRPKLSRYHRQLRRDPRPPLPGFFLRRLERRTPPPSGERRDAHPHRPTAARAPSGSPSLGPSLPALATPFAPLVTSVMRPKSRPQVCRLFLFHVEALVLSNLFCPPRNVRSYRAGRVWEYRLALRSGPASSWPVRMGSQIPLRQRTSGCPWRRCASGARGSRPCGRRGRRISRGRAAASRSWCCPMPSGRSRHDGPAHRPADPVPRRTIRKSRLPSSSSIPRTCTR